MKKLLIGLGIFAVVAVIVIAAVSRRKVAGEGVYAEKVSRGDVVTEITGTGEIQPRTKVNISSEIYGQIVALPVKEGQNVEKGQLLVKIDPEKYRSEVDRLNANVRVSKTAIESEEAGLRNLEIDRRRADELYAQRVISSSDKEKADLAVETSKIQLRSLKESVAQAEAALSRAEGDLAKTTIYAPMSGKITQVNTEVGEQVIVGTTNIPGSVLMVISDMSEILAEVKVDETEIVKLKPGQTAKVTVDAVEKVTYEGRVTEIGNTAVRQGDVSVFNVKVLLLNPDEKLRPGMTAKARIEVDKQTNVLRVPIQAVTARERRELDEEKKKAGVGAGEKKEPGAAPAGKESGTEASAKPAAAKEEGGGAAPAGKGPGAAESAKPASEKGEEAGEGAATAGEASGAAESTKPASEKGEEAGARARPGSEREEIEVVYVIENDKVSAHPVKIGASDDFYVEIKEGLSEGQNVVKGPYRVLRRLKEGDRVVVKDETKALDEASKESESGSSRGGDD
jgi:HlyD family secretion protein